MGDYCLFGLKVCLVWLDGCLLLTNSVSLFVILRYGLFTVVLWVDLVGWLWLTCDVVLVKLVCYCLD